MDVELVRWPGDHVRLDEIRRGGTARLVLVQQGITPPLPADPLEDWIRLPASDEDINLRARVLAERARLNPGRAPILDESGLLRFSGQWTSLPPVEHRLICALLNRYGAVVTRDALARAGWPGAVPGRNVLDVHIVRLRRRLAPLKLVIRTVRSRGYLLEEGGPDVRAAT